MREALSNLARAKDSLPNGDAMGRLSRGGARTSPPMTVREARIRDTGYARRILKSSAPAGRGAGTFA